MQLPTNRNYKSFPKPKLTLRQMYTQYGELCENVNVLLFVVARCEANERKLEAKTPLASAMRRLTSK